MHFTVEFMLFTVCCLHKLQTDQDESKEQESSKLQQSLKEMQKKLDETNALLIEERAAAKRAIEEAAASAVKETPVPVEDTKKIESLSAEVDKLKVSLTYLKIFHPQLCLYKLSIFDCAFLV